MVEEVERKKIMKVSLFNSKQKSLVNIITSGKYLSDLWRESLDHMIVS